MFFCISSFPTSSFSSFSSFFPTNRFLIAPLEPLLTHHFPPPDPPPVTPQSGGGAAWTMDLHVASHRMAVGCEDGGCSIFDLSDDAAEAQIFAVLAHRGDTSVQEELSELCGDGRSAAGLRDNAVQRRLWSCARL